MGFQTVSGIIGPDDFLKKEHKIVKYKNGDRKNWDQQNLVRKNGHRPVGWNQYEPAAGGAGVGKNED